MPYRLATAQQWIIELSLEHSCSQQICHCVQRRPVYAPGDKTGPASGDSLQHAARVALIAFDDGWGEAFTNATYRAQFGDGKNIGETETVAAVVSSLGKNADDIIGRAQSDENKMRLRQQTEDAIARGICGGPSFITAAGELFWGNDRLEGALDWARKTKARR